jgi:hypothetical protein
MEFVLFWTDELSHKMGQSRASNFTEIGWSTAHDGKSGVSELKQAAFLARTLIHATKPSPCTLEMGLSSPDIAKHCSPHINGDTPDLKSIFVYDFQDDGPNPNNTENNFGIVHQDLTPKMGYSAFAQAAGVLRGATFAKWVRFGAQSISNAYIYRTPDGGSLLAMWTSEFVPTGSVKVPADMDYSHEGVTKGQLSLGLVGGGGLAQVALECREWDGHPCSLNPSSIEISNLPVYLKVALPPEQLVIRENNAA